MGYETRLYLASEHAYQSDDEPITCMVMAMVDLSKAGYTTRTGELLKQSRTAAERFYAIYTDVPTDIESSKAAQNSRGLLTKDRYGDRLTAVPVQPLLDALREDNREDPYRRFTWAITLIEAVLPTVQPLDRFRVLQYGY